MNQNERNDAERAEPVGPIEPGDLHEKLCAYVLGEAPDEVRAEVEAALEASAELRAERERLEATIGLVQGALAPAEGTEQDAAEANADRLSPTAAAALMAAAESRRPAGKVLRGPAHWYRSPVLKLAAGVAAVGLVFAAYRELASEESDTSPFVYNIFGGDSASTRMAAAEREVQESSGDELVELKSLGYLGGDSSRASEAVQLDQATLEKLSALGYTDESSNAPSSRILPSAGALRERDVPQSEELRFEDLARADGSRRQKEESLGLGYADAVEPKADVARALRDLGYVEGSPEPAPARQTATGPASPGASTPGAPAGRQIRAGAVVTGSDDFFLGHGEKVARSPAEAAELGQQPERLRKLGYVGGGAAAAQDAPVKDDVTGADFGDGRPHELDLETSRELDRLGYAETAQVQGQLEREQLQRRFDFVIGSCGRRPDERPRDMFFRFWGDNPFETTLLDAQSTFSVDVDTASYTLARRYLTDGHLPEKAQIRTEEFVNYFDADVPAPLEETFRIATELAPSRFGEGPDSWMLRVAVRGKDVSREERQPLTLTFVIDVSGSMKQDGRLELVKHALRLLLTQLDARDSIAIVAFSNEARTILPMTSARNRDLVESAIYQLRPEGGTNAEAGVRMGYALAAAELTRNSHNRVVLLSDGVANIGNTDRDTIAAQVERQRKAGIYLNTVGVGLGNHNDALLEQLADKGDGVCNYVDDEAEARRALVERFTGAFEPIARDVKIQVEFDPTQVQRYRLLGYENRAIADRDFRNDAVDAGEVNAGHQVVALYELQAAPRASADGSERPLATVRLRWKPPHAAGIADLDTEVATEVEQPVLFGDAAPGFTAASAGYRRSVLVGQFAEFLRRSRHAHDDSLDELLAEVRALTTDPAMRDDDDLAELARLIERSRALILAERARRDDWSRAYDTVREACYLQSQLEDLNLLLGRDRLDGLDVAIRDLQQRIAWLRDRVDAAERDLSRAELERFERDNARLAARLRELLREHGTVGRRR